MRATVLSLFALSAVAGLMTVTAVAGDKDKTKPENEAEIRVVVLDAKGVPVGGDTAIVTINLDYGGFQKSLTAESVKAAAPAKVVAGSHGGQTLTTDGYSIEVIVVPKKGPKAAAPEGPYFKATAQIVAYQDSMKDAPPAEKPGKCANCGMSMAEHPATFTAVVALKVGDKTIEAKGFAYPETLAAAATQIGGLLDQIDALIAGGKLSDVRSAADQVSRVAHRLDDDAAPLATADQTAAKKLGDDVAALVDALGKASDANKPEDAKKAAAQIRTKLDALKKLVK